MSAPVPLTPTEPVAVTLAPAREGSGLTFTVATPSVLWVQVPPLTATVPPVTVTAPVALTVPPLTVIPPAPRAFCALSVPPFRQVAGAGQRSAPRRESTSRPSVNGPTDSVVCAVTVPAETLSAPFTPSAAGSG